MASPKVFLAYLKKLMADYRTFEHLYKVQHRNPTCTFEEDVQILNRKALTLGTRCYISKGVILHCGGGQWSGFGGRIDIGDHVYIGPYAVLQGHGEIEIGKNCQIGPQCKIFSLGPSLKKLLLDPSLMEQDVIPHDFNKIVIQDNCIIGAGSLVASGVTIGAGSIILPGSLIHKDVPPGTLMIHKLQIKGVKARPGLFR